MGEKIVVIMEKPKSAAMAFALTLFFGPLGMLYSTPIGALVMFFTFWPALFLAIPTLGLTLIAWVGLELFWATWAAICQQERLQKISQGTS